jgi:hypothetical protein
MLLNAIRPDPQHCTEAHFPRDEGHHRGAMKPGGRLFLSHRGSHWSYGGYSEAMVAHPGDVKAHYESPPLNDGALPWSFEDQDSPWSLGGLACGELFSLF